VKFGKLRIFFEMIKFEHTVFALPFAYIATLLTEQKIPSTAHFVWITVAMVGARTAALSLNRLIDRRLDAQNPRTSGRALPRGLLRASEVWLYTAVSMLMLGLAAYNLSPLAFKLFPAVVFALTFYSYTKRFTWLCHFFLGGTLGLAPLGAWIAIANTIAPEAVVLAVGVLLWVAGFDIIYACDDYDFDRRVGVYSIPARFGIAVALNISLLLHAAAAVCLAVFGIMLGLGLFYWLGVGAAIILLYYQHRLISPDDLSRAGVAFFNLNGSLSVIMLIFTFLDIILR
jgi:4-hydroxybenzoate polyprenyltransferase